MTDRALTLLKRLTVQETAGTKFRRLPRQSLRDFAGTAFSNFFDKRASHPSFKRKEVGGRRTTPKGGGFSFDAERRIPSNFAGCFDQGQVVAQGDPASVPIVCFARRGSKFFVSLVVETCRALCR